MEMLNHVSVTNFAFVQTDFPIGGTRRDKTNWTSKFCHSEGDFMSVNDVADVHYFSFT